MWRSRSALNLDVPYGTRIPAGVHTFEQVTDRTGRGYFLQSFGVSWATSGGSFPFTFSVAEDLQPFGQQLSAYRKNLWGWLGATAVLLTYLIFIWRGFKTARLARRHGAAFAHRAMVHIALGSASAAPARR